MNEVSVPSWVRPGVKVVCVDNKPSGGVGDEVYPIKGQTYTIRSLCGPSPKHLLLVEIINPVRHYREGILEKAFWYTRFKPLVEQKGMETLRAILKNPSDKIKGFEQKKVKRKEHV
jgi:hypothetical protein